ncbi:Ecotropic viral integration site 5 ortholog-like Protein [Tribolium castaneum]|uniref:Ecotropic viral integration site 5 ortholog-like Protein n=1 Tax=Tribolium castaneum TaxID=7070 RepID=D6WFG6_TRICA|nr:PREDICTED: ecotropic viral integration site 5 ortholog [Tribolium castaneum]EEZ99822.1 Ecotropic viral integration site 5 ortholog-like Protein [Tribolium castaneum]|eukprot:XP_008191342.1 PREDICTED: ecotropic viral integration site 5 ortholog [Tribolium castaneum]
MFVNKVHDQKVELLRAVFRNLYLKEKCDYLDSECKMLAEQILSSQVTREKRNESKADLENEFNSLKLLQDEKMHELAVANEKIVALSSVLENSKLSLSESKSMSEVLDVKNEMIKCLQEELVQARLAAAEDWALIRELRQVRDELEKDKEMLTKTKPETIARLQEELMTAKILETQYSVEFAEIRKHLEKIKAEIVAHKTECHLKPEGRIKLFARGAKWVTDDEKKDTKEIEKEIKELEKEKSFLQNKIPDLQAKIDVLSKHIKFKDEERRKLQEKLDSVKTKYQSIESITLERRRQCEHLEHSASEKVHIIRNSCSEKKQNIDDLSNKLGEISDRRQSITKELKQKELTTIQGLEEKIRILEQRIKQLNAEEEEWRESAIITENDLSP